MRHSSRRSVHRSSSRHDPAYTRPPLNRRLTKLLSSRPIRTWSAWRWVVTAALIVLLGTGLPAHAQRAPKVWRIGTLHTSSASDEADRVAALQKGLAEFGYVTGRNVVFLNRNAGTQVDRLPDLANELIRSGVDIIVASTNPATGAAKQATPTIPIVMTVGVDPVDAGLVASLARPGANVTGLSFDVDAKQLAAKRLEILKDLIPSLSRVAILWNPRYRPGVTRVKGTEEAARNFGVTTVSVQLSEKNDLERAFTEIHNAKANAVTVLSDPVLVTLRADLIALAARHRIPVIYALREFVQDGGLISYATSLNDQWQRAARYVDKIFKGAKPGDLPVEQPTTFELWINMKTAKALNLTIPPALLLRTNRVLE